MSVTRTTIEETMRKLNEGEWEALSAITEHGMVLLRNPRTGSRFNACVVDYRHVSEPKGKVANR